MTTNEHCATEYISHTVHLISMTEHERALGMKDTPCIIVLMRERVTELHVNCVYLRGVYYDVYVLQMLIHTSS
jgi:hypothetical protein